MAPLLAGEVDYLSLALGESPSYLGSTLIVPPPPLGENLIEEHLEPFRVGLPLIATSRVIDPVEADRIVDTGAADAVGMTRALIADPDLPAKARDGRSRADRALHRLPGLHRPLPRGRGDPVRDHPAHRPRAVVAATAVRRRAARRLVVVGAGPAGLAAAAEAAAAGHEVIVLERAERIGGQLALALGGARPRQPSPPRSSPTSRERSRPSTFGSAAKQPPRP